MHLAGLTCIQTSCQISHDIHWYHWLLQQDGLAVRFDSASARLMQEVTFTLSL